MKNVSANDIHYIFFGETSLTKSLLNSQTLFYNQATNENIKLRVTLTNEKFILHDDEYKYLVTINLSTYVGQCVTLNNLRSVRVRAILRLYLMESFNHGKLLSLLSHPGVCLQSYGIEINLFTLFKCNPWYLSINRIYLLTNVCRFYSSGRFGCLITSLFFYGYWNMFV